MQFPDDGFTVATDSQQFEVTATITLESSDYQDEYQEDKKFVNGELHLEIYNIGAEPLLDFRWVGEWDQELQEYFAWGRQKLLNAPHIETRYSMLLSNILFRTKHDMYQRDAILPDYEGEERRWPTRGYIYGDQLGLWYSATTQDVSEVLACFNKPIRLKLMHEGGTEYLLVYPEVDTSGIKP